MSKTILGLDIGTASVGWALLRGEQQEEGSYLVPVDLIAMGVRVFPEGVEPKRGEPRNRKRREARSMRRRLQRKARRLKALRKLLIDAKLLPLSLEEFRCLLATTDPYELRARGITTQLKPYELGRALYHLAHRRGYLSNRKDRSAETTEGVVATALADLSSKMKDSRSPTVGAYLAGVDPREARRRARYLSRKDIAKEIYLLLKKQKAYHPFLSRSLREKIYWSIIFQRPLKPQRNFIGRCSVFPTEKRAPKYALVSQEFNLYQSLANLRVNFSHQANDRCLSEEEYRLLEAKLRKTKSLSWKQVQETLESTGHKPGVRYNLESSTSRLTGLDTEVTWKKSLKASWEKLDQQKKEELLNLVHHSTNEAKLKRLLKLKWSFSDEEIELALSNDRKLLPGYANLSRRAMKKALVILKKNPPYCQKPVSVKEALDRILSADYVEDKALLNDILSPLPVDVRNPIVQRSFSQVRKVVNAVIRKFGKPTEIHVELARDLSLSRDKKRDLVKLQNKNRELNEQAKDFLIEHGINSPSSTDLVRFRLWNECGKECPYTGKPISFEQLFGEHRVFDIEHIIPYSRSLDNSYMNLTLCCLNENTRKTNRTPFEFYNNDSARMTEILQRIRRQGLPYPKQQRFRQKELSTDGFISRQLNDTRYVSRLAKEKLEAVVDRVTVAKGQTTAHLRAAWGLDFVSHQKGKDRSDHRHHAIDAVVIACTSPSLLFRLSLESKFRNGFLSYQAKPPFPGFREAVIMAYSELKVSHRPARRLAGELHEETLYRTRRDQKGKKVTYLRTPTANLNDSKVSKIVPSELQTSIEQQLKGSKTLYGKFAGKVVQIRGVTLISAGATVSIRQSQHAVKTGNNFAIIIYEDDKGSWGGRIITRLEAAQNFASNRALCLQDSLPANSKLIMLAQNGDMILITHEAQRKLYVLQKMSQEENGSLRLVLRPHHDSLKGESEGYPLRKTPKTFKELNPRKVEVSPLGEILYVYERSDSSSGEVRIPYSNSEEAAHSRAG